MSPGVKTSSSSSWGAQHASLTNNIAIDITTTVVNCDNNYHNNKLFAYFALKSLRNKNKNQVSKILTVTVIHHDNY